MMVQQMALLNKLLALKSKESKKELNTDIINLDDEANICKQLFRKEKKTEANICKQLFRKEKKTEPCSLESPIPTKGIYVQTR